MAGLRLKTVGFIDHSHDDSCYQHSHMADKGTVALFRKLNLARDQARTDTVVEPR